MIRAVRSFALVVLATTLGVFQACACAHETAAHGGHAAHVKPAVEAGAGRHGHHAMHASTEVVGTHEAACGSAAPECDHAPDASAVVAKVNVDLGSKLVQPVAYAALAPVAFVDRFALRTVGQTGPPVRWRSPVAETPVSLKVRLLA